MIRSITLFCLPMCLAAFLLAQTPEQPASTESAAATKAQSKQSAPSAKESAGAKGTTSAANVQYPLDAFRNFSAVMVGSVAGDEEESHIYRLGRLMRTEVGGSYAVTDLTKGDTYGVSPKGCLHDTHPAFRVFPFDVSSPTRKVERAPSGKETVDGHPCNIEDVTVTSTGPTAHSLKMRFWEADDLQGFPVKVEVLSSFGRNKTIRYKDVVLAPPDAALFKHPANCQVLAPKDLPAVPTPPPAPKKVPASPPPSNPQK